MTQECIMLHAGDGDAEAADTAADGAEVKAVQEDENAEDEDGAEETALAQAASPLPHVASKAKAKRSVQWVGKALDSSTAASTKFYRRVTLGCRRALILCGKLLQNSGHII